MAAILLIEDDPTLQEAYSFMLQARGHEIAAAYNGEEGLVHALEKPYNLILLDIHMPVMDGWEFLTRYQDKRTDATKIIVFSNMVEPELEKKATELGAYRSVLKSSMTPSTLMKLIDETLSSAQPADQ